MRELRYINDLVIREESEAKIINRITEAVFNLKNHNQAIPKITPLKPYTPALI